MGEQVEGNPQLFPRFQKQSVIARHHLGRRNPLLVRPDGDRRAMGVAARHHQHPAAFKPVIAGEDVRRQITPGHMAQMQRPVGVRPGNGDQYAFPHIVPPKIPFTLSWPGYCSTSRRCAVSAAAFRGDPRLLAGRELRPPKLPFTGNELAGSD